MNLTRRAAQKIGVRSFRTVDSPMTGHEGASDNERARGLEKPSFEALDRFVRAHLTGNCRLAPIRERV